MLLGCVVLTVLGRSAPRRSGLAERLAADGLGAPLADLSVRLEWNAFRAVVVVMVLAYLAVLTCARALSPRWMLAAVVAAHLVVVLTPPRPQTDVFYYLALGRLGAVHGLNPYEAGPAAMAPDPVLPYVSGLYENTPSVYGPLFMLVSHALAPLGLAGGVWALKVLAMLGSLACVYVVFAASERLGRSTAQRSALVGLNPLLLVYGVSNAHNDFLMMVATAAGVYLVYMQRAALGAGFTAAAAAVKLSGALVLPLLLVGVRRWRAVLGAAVAAAAIGIVTLAVFGTAPSRVPGAVGELQGRRTSHSVPGLLGSWLGSGPPSDRVQRGLELSLAVLVVALVVLVWLRRMQWVAAAAWATAGLLLISSPLFAWYVVWLLALAALAPGHGPRTAAVLMTVLVVAMQLFGGLARRRATEDRAAAAAVAVPPPNASPGSAKRAEAGSPQPQLRAGGSSTDDSSQPRTRPGANLPRTTSTKLQETMYFP